jgi:hypothetical protein
LSALALRASALSHELVAMQRPDSRSMTRDRPGSVHGRDRRHDVVPDVDDAGLDGSGVTWIVVEP